MPEDIREKLVWSIDTLLRFHLQYCLADAAAGETGLRVASDLRDIDDWLLETKLRSVPDYEDRDVHNRPG